MIIADFNVEDTPRVKYVGEQLWLLKNSEVENSCHIKNNFSFKGAWERHAGNFLTELPMVWTTETQFKTYLAWTI